MTNKRDIELSVLMTAYNAEQYISLAIESILNQTFTDFEFIIINDGSTDNTLQIIQSYKDARIRIINEGKFGYYKAKQRLIEEATGKYIAIMDADDICDASRLELEYNFLEQHLDYGLIGTNAKWIDSNGKQFSKGFNFDASNEELKCNLLFFNCFVHTSVLFRKSILIENNINYKTIAGEDWDMWIQIAKHSKIKNIIEQLIQYRIHNNNMVHSNWYKLDEGLQTILFQQLEDYFSNQFTLQEKQAYYKLVNLQTKCNKNDLQQVYNFIEKLINLNQQCNIYNDETLHKTILNRWSKRIIRLSEYNKEIKQIHNKIMQLFKNMNYTVFNRMAFFILELNCFLKRKVISRK